MKKSRLFKIFTLAMVLFFLMATVATAAWTTTNSATVHWNEVTENKDGDPIDPIFETRYGVHLANALTDPNIENPTELAEVTDLSYLVTLNAQGRYWFGVQCRLYLDDALALESSISWSNDPTKTQSGEEIGLQYFTISPKDPEGLSIG